MAKILLVEDDASLRDALIELLIRYGYEIIAASSMITTIDMLTAPGFGRPDLIISDVDIPDADGLELYRKVEETLEVETPPILFLSVASHPEIKGLALKTSRVLFLRKPFESKTLIEYVSKGLTESASPANIEKTP